MKTEYEFGDVVEMGMNDDPQVAVVFGELAHPSEGGHVYVVGDKDLFGLPTTGDTSFRKTGVDIKAATAYRKRYLKKAKGGLKELD